MSDAASNRASRFSRVASRFRSSADIWLAARIAAWACVLPVLKHVVPIQRLVPWLYRPGRGGARNPECEDQVVAFARWACRLMQWSSGGNCLERGLIVYRFLGALDAEPLLVVGIGHGERGDIRGHAWVIVDGQPVGESLDSLSEFSSVVTFGPGGTALTGAAN